MTFNNDIYYKLKFIYLSYKFKELINVNFVETLTYIIKSNSEYTFNENKILLRSLSIYSLSC